MAKKTSKASSRSTDADRASADSPEPKTRSKTGKAASPKKTATKKTTKKKTVSKSGAGDAPSSKTTPSKTASAKKATTKKSTSKKTAANKKSSTAKTPSTKKPTSKKPAAKDTASKTPTKKKPATKKPTTKKSTSKKSTSKKTGSASETPAAKPDGKGASGTASGAASKPQSSGSKKPDNDTAGKAGGTPDSKQDAKIGPDGKPVRKGITIVDKKPMRKSSPKKVEFKPPAMGSILTAGKAPPRPLIPSGASVQPETITQADDGKPVKSPFKKRELDKYRELLIEHRNRALGLIDSVETMALRGEGGASSHTPQHLADQGSDTADQSLSLDLAAADRRKIRDIDEALQRITDGVYGVCELTRKPIEPDRLTEIPWTRFSVEGARQMEQRQGRS